MVAEGPEFDQGASATDARRAVAGERNLARNLVGRLQSVE